MTDADIDKALAELSDDTLRGLVDGTHRLAWHRPRDLVTRLAGEVLRLRRQVEGHCDRIAAQSDLLSRRAEKPAAVDEGVETLAIRQQAELLPSLEKKLTHQPPAGAPCVGSVWKHFKGGVYTVTAVTVAEATKATLVSYESPEGRAKGDPPWTRPLVGADNAFFGDVVSESGEKMPRFVEINKHYIPVEVTSGTAPLEVSSPNTEVQVTQDGGHPYRLEYRYQDGSEFSGCVYPTRVAAEEAATRASKIDPTVTVYVRSAEKTDNEDRS